MGDAEHNDRATLAAQALARARSELKHLDEALELTAQAITSISEADEASACLVVETLRVARRDAEAALRDAQEAADLAIDHTAQPKTEGTRPVTGTCVKVAVQRRDVG